MWGYILVYRDRLLLWAFPSKHHNSQGKMLETTYVTSFRGTINEIILAVTIAHRMASIRITQYLSIALDTDRFILHRTNAVWI